MKLYIYSVQFGILFVLAPVQSVAVQQHCTVLVLHCTAALYNTVLYCCYKASYSTLYSVPVVHCKCLSCNFFPVQYCTVQYCTATFNILSWWNVLRDFLLLLTWSQIASLYCTALHCLFLYLLYPVLHFTVLCYTLLPKLLSITQHCTECPVPVHYPMHFPVVPYFTNMFNSALVMPTLNTLQFFSAALSWLWCTLYLTAVSTVMAYSIAGDVGKVQSIVTTTSLGHSLSMDSGQCTVQEGQCTVRAVQFVSAQLTVYCTVYKTLCRVHTLCQCTADSGAQLTVYCTPEQCMVDSVLW